MLDIRADQREYHVPKHVSINAIREWVRHVVPDIRVQTRRLPDGTRGCAAKFTFGGEELFTESLESATNPSPDEDVWRRTAWILNARMGVRTELADEERALLEQQIVDAARNGLTEQADALARHLAMSNEGYVVGPLRTKFTDFGGSMFQGDKSR